MTLDGYDNDLTSDIPGDEVTFFGKTCVQNVRVNSPRCARVILWLTIAILRPKGAWGIGHSGELRISDLSCGLPPFGRVPSFGLRIEERHKAQGPRKDVEVVIIVKLTWFAAS
jgi:hypothetical protein